MKTIKQWLETLKEPYKSQALANLSEYAAEVKVKNVSEAIIRAFDWDVTTEGFNYWDRLHDKAAINPNSVIESAET